MPRRWTKNRVFAAKEINDELNKTDLDLTLPGYPVAKGHRHPLSVAQDRMTAILSRLGFEWAEGPWVEDEKHNFDLLNIPLHHPARDAQDTFLWTVKYRLYCARIRPMCKAGIWKTQTAAAHYGPRPRI